MHFSIASLLCEAFDDSIKLKVYSHDTFPTCRTRKHWMHRFSRSACGIFSLLLACPVGSLVSPFQNVCACLRERAYMQRRSIDIGK